MDKYKNFALVAILSLIVSLFVTSNASAHVTIKPSETESGKYTTFSVNVPNERTASTTKIKLDIPDGVTAVTPNVKPGWKIDIEKSGASSDDSHSDSGVVKSITWSDGTIPDGQRDEFLFGAKVPSGSDQLVWKAYQTYSDGKVVAWDKSDQDQPKKDDGSPDFSESGPFSVTSIINPNTAQNTDGTSSSDTNRSIYIAIAALVVSFISLAIASRSKN